MTERISKSFRVVISNAEELKPLRKMFGVEKFREIVAGMGEQVASKIREQRSPATGEFPVVTSQPIAEDALRIEIEGSLQLHEFLAVRLPEIGFNFQQILPGEGNKAAPNAPKPIVFLSHASEDNALAKRIATALMAKGIDTFYDEWELRSGDSIRRKLEQGLEGCTHFVVLLSPVSITRPWVQTEIDAGFLGMVGGKNRFIGLRFGVAASALSPFLQTLWSPGISEASFDDDVAMLVGDIYGVSRKPEAGAAPSYLAAAVGDVSPAAAAIAKFFVEKSKLAMDLDPQTSIEDLEPALGLHEEDLIDAIDELKGLGCVRTLPVLGARKTWTTGPHKRLFTRFDRYWKEWDPAKDAILIAQEVFQASSVNTAKVAETLGWPPRRVNPALTYLMDRELVQVSREISSQFVASSMRSSDETRRFLKGQG